MQHSKQEAKAIRTPKKQSKLKNDRSESNEVIRGDIGNLQQHMLAHMINRRSHQSSLRSYFDPLYH